MIEKYISQGTMRPIKWTLGLILILVGTSELLNFDFIINYTLTYSKILSFILILSGYLLYIAGRRK